MMLSVRSQGKTSTPEKSSGTMPELHVFFPHSMA